MAQKTKPKKKALYKHARQVIEQVEEKVRDGEDEDESKAEEAELVFTGMRLLVDMAESANRIANALALEAKQ